MILPHLATLGILWGERRVGTSCTGLWPGQQKLKKFTLAYRLTAGCRGGHAVPLGPFFRRLCFHSSCALVILCRGLLTDALWPLFQILVRKLPDGRELWGRIVETEAYLGGEDEASHSKGVKQTQRNAAMFMKPGTLYVYQIYGIYFCVNVSSQGKLRLKVF